MFPNRRIHGLVLYLLAAAVAAPHAGTQSARPAKQYTMEQFLNTTSITGATFSRDESRILFSSNKSGIWNAYTVSTAAARGRKSPIRPPIPPTPCPTSGPTIVSS
jgi:hypothetical protein